MLKLRVFNKPNEVEKYLQVKLFNKWFTLWHKIK